MGKSPCCSKEGLNKGAWTAMEDKILTEYIETHGEGKWRHLPKRAGLKRCGKSCRLRWLNYLRPGIKRGNITNDEEELIIRLHNLLGNRWSLIAGRLPGRTDNEIKNYWNTNIGRKLQNGIITTPNCSITSSGGHISSLNSARDQQQGRYMKTTQECHTSPHPPNKGSYNNNVVQTKATRWTTKVTVTKKITQQNEGVIENINVVDNKILKGSPVVSSPSENNIDDPLLLDNFMADFDDEMDENFFSELLKMDLPELSCLENNMLLEDNGNPSSTVDKGQYYISPESSNDTHFSWGDSLYDTGFDFQTTATIMESGFDWL